VATQLFSCSLTTAAKICRDRSVPGRMPISKASSIKRSARSLIRPLSGASSLSSAPLSKHRALLTRYCASQSSLLLKSAKLNGAPCVYIMKVSKSRARALPCSICQTLHNLFHSYLRLRRLSRAKTVILGSKTPAFCSNHRTRVLRWSELRWRAMTHRRLPARRPPSEPCHS